MQQAKKGQLKLWYQQPATDWNEALPLGNGKLGAMVFGGVDTDRFQLNEETIWDGEPNHRIAPYAKYLVEKTREAIFAGKLKEADEMALLAYRGNDQGSYQTLGDLTLEFDHKQPTYTNYRRELDLETAIATTRYRMGNDYYYREALVSAPDQVLAIHLSCIRGAFNLRIKLSRPQYDYITTTEIPNTLMMYGKCGNGTIKFCTQVKVKAHFSYGGKITYESDHIVINNAREVTIYLTAASTYAHADPVSICQERLQSAEKKGYAQIKADHIKEYQELFNRVQFTLDSSSNSGELPIDERLMRVNEGTDDPELAVLYYQFGRYLLISSSRPDAQLPANLQGIWNEHMQAPWKGRYTININTEMNYWPAEQCNLSECHEPLFKLIERLKESGRKIARDLYGCRGFVAHHNTNIWADASPQDQWSVSTYWPMGAAWLCLHLWERYEYTLDESFLAQAYPTMREAAEFFIDFLVEDKNGYLVTCPSLSPENSYIAPDGHRTALCAGPSMDTQIIRQLYTACIAAANILKTDEDFCQQLAQILEKLPPIQTTSLGTIREWLEDYPEIEPGHRHISHLFALYPADQISVENTPVLAEAARKTLERRLSHGGGHTGWSCAWIINMWARLQDSANAYKYLQMLLGKSTYPNMFDAHPPFQIDGNFGGTAGINEMLLQSHGGLIRLLPALPAQWPSGTIKGIKARGNYEITINWAAGKLVEAQILPLPINNPSQASEPRVVKVKYPQISTYKIYCDGVEIPSQYLDDNTIAFPVEAHKIYSICSADR